MNNDPDDIHGFDRALEMALKRLDDPIVSPNNKELIHRFIRASKKKGDRKSTLARDCNLMRWILKRYKGDLDKMTDLDFDDLIDSLERDKKDDYNYRKLVKKFFRWYTQDEVPKWVRNIKMPRNKTPVQPSDLLTKDEIESLLDACEHPRDKAMIAVALDSSLRVGALGTMRVKNVTFSNYGAVLYISPTSRNVKTTKPQPVPLTWSTGYINKWLDVHPSKDDPNAPLWVNLRGPSRGLAMQYKTIRLTLAEISERGGVKKKVFYHLFRHQKITEMILQGYSEQQIKFQAGWTQNSEQMLRTYGNFTDKDMVASIFERSGLKIPNEDSRIELKQCPRCNAALMPGAKACHQCALILDASLDKERLGIEDDVAQKAFLKMMENPKIMAMFKEMVNK
ncbi:hypothetical protein METP3_03232 [Methanosarcinales archaeon]|nr:hypothetical protein METP3_03232 [Methanosarcinales archaeon]